MSDMVMFNDPGRTGKWISYGAQSMFASRAGYPFSPRLPRMESIYRQDGSRGTLLATHKDWSYL